MRHSSSRSARFRLVLVAGLLSVGRLVTAQVTNGNVMGRVVDPTGQPLAGAVIAAADTERGGERATRTDALGSYRLLDLAPGVYALSASAPGFAEARSASVAVSVDTTARVDFTLPVAGLVQAVEVTATLYPLQADALGTGAVFDRQRIDRLPLNRRDFLQLAMLGAGVADPVEDSELSSRGAVAMHANGAREEFNNFLLDGVDNNDPYVNRYVMQPPVDAIQEFKIATGSYSAEYGRSGGAQVNVVTRHGTNDLHGVGYEYFRDRTLDARNYFETGARAAYRRNQAGGGIGGPIARDRTFYFVSADVLRERKGFNRLATVPSDAARRGDLSALGVTVVDPFTGQPFPGNVIPASRISPIAARVLELFPIATQAGGAANYLGQPVQRDDEAQATARIDHSFGPAHRLAVRYSQARTTLFEPYAEETGAVPGFGDTLTDRTYGGSAEYSRTLGPHALSTLRVGAHRFSRRLINEGADADVAAEWGVGWLPADSPGYPTINVAGYSRLGDVTSLPIIRHTDTVHVVESLTVDRGAHLVKAGAEVRHMRLDGRLDMLTRGTLSFSGAITGSGIGDLLLGFPSFTLQARADNPISMRSTAFGAFLQDEWRVARELTVSAGVRYDIVTPPVDPHDRMSAFDLASGTVVQVGTAGVSRSGVALDRNNIAPRLGVVWTPAADLVVRGGYGIYYDASMFTVSSAQYFNPPYFTLRMHFPSRTRLLTLADPFPAGAGLTPPASLSTLSDDLASAVIHHWNVTVERSLGRLGALSVAYVGSAGAHLVRARDLNQPAPGAGDVQARRPYPAYGSIFFVESEGASRYHALQATLNRPLRHGMSLLASYTFARSMDDASAFLATASDRNFPQDSRNVDAEWARSSYDVRHRATIAGFATLPQRRAWTRNTEVRALVTLRSGQPLTPVLRFDNSNTGNGGQTTGWDRPNVVASPALAAPTAAQWFDPAAFAVPARYTFGNAGRNIVTGPGFASVDASIVRRFPRPRGWSIAVDLQAFNLLNRANFDQPELFADEPATFGRVLSAKAPRQVQLAMRVEF